MTQLSAHPQAGRDPVVGCAVYRDGERLEGGRDVAGAVRLVRERGGFVWIGLHEPDGRTLTEVAEPFALHPLAVEDAVKAHQRPKLEAYGEDMLFLVLKTVRYCPHDEAATPSDLVEVGEVAVFLGPDYVVTVRHGAHGGLAGLRARLEEQPQLLRRGPSAVLHAVTDLVVDTYLEVAAELEGDLFPLESSVFSPRRDRRDIERTYVVKREVLQLKHAITPLAGPMHGLVSSAHPLVHEQVREYLRDVEDHVTRARELVAGYDEVLDSILQAGLAQLSIAENEDMRKLAAWAAIIAVPTAIAGIYGMNFQHMPELDWRWGYPAVLVAMAAACVVLYRGFKRSGWL